MTNGSLMNSSNVLQNEIKFLMEPLTNFEQKICAFNGK